jgi:phenylalanyl-tRNA synthetase alpha chain
MEMKMIKFNEKSGGISMKQELSQILDEASAEIKAGADLEQVRIKYLGKKGRLTDILKQLGKLSAEERPSIGAFANEIKVQIEEVIVKEQKKLASANIEKQLREEKIDITLPSSFKAPGKRHPISQITSEIEEIFIGMGFEIAQGPEVEFAYYNFDALNMPKNHPARETGHTFYISKDEEEVPDDDIILRTHTSSVQIRAMEKNNKPPIKLIAPGRVFRYDLSPRHSPVFHQVEGLVVDKNITLGDLKHTLEILVAGLFGEGTEIRLRPHHFSFTEPSVEADFKCFVCGGSGASCALCKGEGWIEIVGAGMVHSKVLSLCGIDPEIYTGFAFGFGLDRLAMMKYGIDDIRLLFENDIRFLRQF